MSANHSIIADVVKEMKSKLSPEAQEYMDNCIKAYLEYNNVCTGLENMSDVDVFSEMNWDDSYIELIQVGAELFEYIFAQVAEKSEKCNELKADIANVA